jgi:hypothetical protein
MKQSGVFVVLAAIAAALVLQGVPAAATGGSAGFTLFGDAALVHPGNASFTAVRIRSSVAVPPGYGGIDFTVPAGMTFNDLNNLATDYNFIHNSCGGGSPRFQINVTNGTASGNIFVYIGPPPNYTLCPPGWTNTGNLLAPTNLIDTSQLPLGTFYDPELAAKAKYGSYQVTGIQVVADGSWVFLDGEQTVLVDNVQINTTLYTFEKDCGNHFGHGNGGGMGGKQQFQFDKEGCDKNDRDNAKHDDDESSHHFQSSSVDYAVYDTAGSGRQMTMVGSGYDNGAPVTFTIVAVDFGGLIPANYSIVLSNGYAWAGNVIGIVNIQ